MTNKELTLLGMSLKALMDVGAIDQVKEIVAVMADVDTEKVEKKAKINQKTKKNGGEPK
ncbi:MAG: hypothetical protein FWH20_01675 [Oscillospiraceae bacterium]|nr:hypothetical protein [Oscillospiraceae bacterium]